MSLSLILTCYNEVPRLFESYQKIVSLMSLTTIDYEIIVVDDGSTPPVRQKLIDFFRDRKQSSLICSDQNEGRGAAVIRGIQASRYEVAGFIDTDLEIPEDSILKLYHLLIQEDLDLIIGKRFYIKRWRLRDWIRYVMSRLYFLLANLVLSLNFLDTESGIKLFRREKIRGRLNDIQDKRWFWDTELVAECLRNNFKVRQVPVFVQRNKNSQSSVKIFRDGFRYLKALLNYRTRKMNHRPDIL